MHRCTYRAIQPLGSQRARAFISNGRLPVFRSTMDHYPICTLPGAWLASTAKGSHFSAVCGPPTTTPVCQSTLSPHYSKNLSNPTWIHSFSRKSLDTYLYVDDADISTALHISFFSRKASPTISADTIAHSHNTCGGDGRGQRR